MVRGPTPFRFENMWLKEDGFKDLVKSWWQGLNFRRTSSFVISKKIKALKPLIRAWNKDVFGRVENNKKEALETIDHWDKVEGQRSLLPREREERVAARSNYSKWALMQEIT